MGQPCGVDGHAQHPLGQIRPTVPGVAPLAPLGLRVPVTVQAGGVDEHHVQGLVEQVQVPAKEPGFQVLPHPGQKRRGPVEVLQGQALEPRGFHRPDPLRAGEIGAGSAQPLQGHGESSPFQIELELPVLGQFPEQVGEPLPVPQPPKDQGRPPLPGGAGGQPRGPDRFHHPQVVAEFSQTAHQAVQLSRSYQAVAAAQGGNHLLADLTPFPVGPDNLQIFIGSAISDTTFAPHEHDIICYA